MLNRSKADRTLRGRASCVSWMLGLLGATLSTGCGGGTTAPAAAPAPPPPAQGLAWLRAEGTQWINAQGNPVLLKGTNLGNWLVQEFWMMGLGGGGVIDQCTLEARLTERFGYAQKERLIKLFRDSWITERDWDQLKAFGFNVVRLPILWSVIEDEMKPKTLRADAWHYIDGAIAAAKQRGMYVILDLHGAVGGQTPNDHTGCTGQNKYWTNAEAQERTRWLWRQIANRYKDEPAVAAYDPLNEPWGASAEAMVERVEELVRVIRAVDDRHIVLLPSYYGSVAAYGNPGAKGLTNVAFQIHPYPGLFGDRPGESHYKIHRDWLRCGESGIGGVCAYAKQMSVLNTPLLVGEFQPWQGAGLELGGQIGRASYDTYASFGWAATSWSYKVVSPGGGIGKGNWGMVTNAPAPGIKLDFSTANLSEIESLFKGFATQAYEVHPGLSRWLGSSSAPEIFQLPPRPTGLQLMEGAAGHALSWTPSSDPRVTGYGVYRMGGTQTTGGAHSQLAEQLRSGHYTDTSAVPGVHYRYAVTAQTNNDESFYSDWAATAPQYVQVPATLEAESFSDMRGIQLENCSDIGGGQDVGYFDPEDFVEFQITVTTAGRFNIDYRLASATGSSGFEVWVDGVKVLDAMTVPNTGGWQTWLTRSSETFSMQAGQHTLRLKSVGREWNLNWIRVNAR